METNQIENNVICNTLNHLIKEQQQLLMQKQKIKLYIIENLLQLFNQQKSNQNKYEIYRFISHLCQSSQEQISQQVIMNKKDDVQNILKCLTDSWVKNIANLKIKAYLSQYQEFSYINLSFNTSFQLEHVINNDVTQLFINIENRLQKIDSLKEFTIIYNIRLQKVVNHLLYTSRDQNDDELLNDIYDVIIVSSTQYDNLQSLKIRYLNYIGRDHEIVLQHPQYLITATLCHVRILNINECANLTNLYSEWNTYKLENIASLTNIKRFYSMLDTYDDQNVCMLKQLFSTNKLEYCSVVQEDNQEYNVINNCVINNHIENLKYLYIFSEFPCNVSLDIHQKYPYNLLLFDVTSFNEDHNEIYGSIDGPPELIQQIKSQLIHQINNQNNNKITESLL